MKNILLTGLVSAIMLTACKKDDQVAEKTLEQQKIEFQARQLEIEKQKLAIEKERFAYETQKRTDSIAEVQKEKEARAAAKPQVIRETRTIYRDTPSSNNSVASNGGGSSSQGTTAKKKGISEAAKGTAIGVVSGAALGAIVNKKNRGGGAVVGGIIGGATGYTLGRSQDRKSGRVQPR